MFRRLLATTATALTLACVAAVPAAVPAHASPEDGQGCAGLPDFPAAYVCIISVTPTGALPTVTTSSIPVTVPRVCYVAGCTAPTTVNVPVPGATLGTGNVAVLWYQGVQYPIGMGTGAVITPIVNGILTTVTTTVNGVVTFAITTVNNTITFVNGVVGTVNGLVGTAVQIVNAQVQAALAEVTRIANEAPGAIDDFVDEQLEPFREPVRQLLDAIRDLDVNEEIQQVVDRLQPTLDRIGEIVQNVLESIRT